MTARLRILAAAALFVGLGFVAGSGGADAASTVTISPSIEAWYQPNPTCDLGLPAGCISPSMLPTLPVPVPVPVTLPAVNPYPAGTMHVAVTAGRESARTYLALPVADLDGVVTAATLTIPLDSTPTSGSQLPEAARVRVCLFSKDVVAVEGSIDTAPPVLCEGAATLTYRPAPTPHLHGDLASLAAGLLTSTGIALLPAADIGPTEAWHVAFSARTRTGEGIPAPASLTLQLADPVEDGALDNPMLEVDEFPLFPDVPSSAFDGSGFVDLDAPPPAPVFETALPDAAPVAATPEPVGVGYSYAAVWLLPLALLVLVPAVSRALTKDLSDPPS